MTDPTPPDVSAMPIPSSGIPQANQLAKVRQLVAASQGGHAAQKPLGRVLGLKGELGIDHYEGRRFPGWHHHVSVALCCFAFVVAERHRIFPSRPDGEVRLVRTESRPERHFSDSFITVRLAVSGLF